MSLKKGLICVFTLFIAFCMSGCNEDLINISKGPIKIAMTTDTGGVNDQSFNQSSWAGLQNFNKQTGIQVSYLEAQQASDFDSNFDKLADAGNSLIWGIGFTTADSVLYASKFNPDINYAIVDFEFGENTPQNVTGVMFRAQESSFLVGYIAGKTTKTNKVGFIGGMTSLIIDQFQYGYQAGVDYAAKEQGKTIQTSVQYAESFSDSAKGRAIATKLYSEGCDVIFHASAAVGLGLIETAKNFNKWAIGVDMDQSYLAPDNVLTSAMKNVDQAVVKVCSDFVDGKNIGGKTYSFGIKENGVGIPENNKNLDAQVYADTIIIRDKIANGEIVPPYNAQTYQEFTI